VRNCGASGEYARLSVHHLTPARWGGGDTMDNLITLCSGCHSQFERATRSLVLPLDTPPARKRTRQQRTKNHDRYASHPAPYRGPDGQPWSREW
jgi:HNH endonuclease